MTLLPPWHTWQQPASISSSFCLLCQTSGKSAVMWYVCTHPSWCGPTLGGGCPCSGKPSSEAGAMWWHWAPCPVHVGAHMIESDRYPGGTHRGDPNKESPAGGWSSALMSILARRSPCQAHFARRPRLHNCCWGSKAGEMPQHYNTNMWGRNATIKQYKAKAKNKRYLTGLVWKCGQEQQQPDVRTRACEEQVRKTEGLAARRINLELNNIMYFKGGIIKSPDTLL